MELMNEEDPQMLQQQADKAAIKANRGGTPDRTLTPSSTIQDLGMQSVAQMKDFSKFNSMAMKLEDLSGDGKITKKDFLIGAKVIDKEGNKL
jgi:hypothetical protein